MALAVSSSRNVAALSKQFNEKHSEPRPFDVIGADGSLGLVIATSATEARSIASRRWPGTRVEVRHFQPSNGRMETAALMHR